MRAEGGWLRAASNPAVTMLRRASHALVVIVGLWHLLGFSSATAPPPASLPSPHAVSPLLASKAPLRSNRLSESQWASLAPRLIGNARSLAAAAGRDAALTERTFNVLGHELVIRDTGSANSPEFIAGELSGDCYELLRLPAATNSSGEGMLFLDLGTNVGMTAILLAKLFPLATVLGIEPMPLNYASALHNIAANGVADRVHVLHGALSSSGAPVTLNYWKDNTGASRTQAQESGAPISANSVGSYTVEEVLALFAVDPCTAYVPFIKFDCEGCEWDVLPSLSPPLVALFGDAQVRGEVHQATAASQALTDLVFSRIHNTPLAFARPNAASRCQG